MRRHHFAFVLLYSRRFSYFRAWTVSAVLFTMSIFMTHVSSITDAKDDCSSVKFTEFLGGKYLIGDKSMTWLDAHTCCITQNMRLVSLVTEEITLSLAKELGEKLDKAAELWTSAQNVAGVHIWTGVGRTLKNYTSWAPGQPISPVNSSAEIKQECVSAKLNGTDSILWSDESCDKTRLVACERHPGCKDGPADRISRKIEARAASVHSVDTVQYAFADEKQTWIEGYRYCRKQGLQLVSLEREAKAEKLVKLWFSVRKDAFWTSGTEVGRYDKHFYWATIGKEFGYHDFETLPDPKRDNKNCILIQSAKNGSWIDEECGKTHGIICEMYTGCEGCA